MGSRTCQYFRTLFLALLTLSFLHQFSVVNERGHPNINRGDRQIVPVQFSLSHPQHHPWPGEGECGLLVTRFARRGSLPTRALVSYPGSGNTWVRYLIGKIRYLKILQKCKKSFIRCIAEGSTGVYTGSVFRDKTIDIAGHHGEMREFQDGSTIVQKTHHK